MTMNRHEPFEELISASLTGDLTDVERQRLDAHLDSCAACRATLAAFADQRRIVAGLRHLAPPRDLGARVRTGVERGAFATLPWWRRPAVMFAGVGGSLAAVAGVLLALVLLNGSPDDAEVGGATPSPTAATTTAVTPSPSEEPRTTLPPILPTPPPDASPVESTAPPSASVEPSPTTTPVPPSPEPDVFLALTGPFDNLNLTVQEPAPSGEPPAPIAQVEVVEAPNGPPIAAELSPDGQWLAFIAELGQSGQNEVRVTRVAAAPGDTLSPLDVGGVVILGRSVAGTPFLERLAWSPDSRRLAYTLADPDADGATDVWIFEPGASEPVRLTDFGNAYAASWIPTREGDADASRLWVSIASDEPASYVLDLTRAEEIAVADPIEDAVQDAPGVFLPTLSPDGRLAIYWTGRMARQEGLGWIMSDGGEPYLAEHDIGDATYEFFNERPLFSDLRVDREGFASAAISWGADGDAYAVWDAAWTGDSQGTDDSQYPDRLRVYFGHATDARGLTRSHAIDEADLPEDGNVVDVKVSPTGEHLLVTVRHPLEGDLSVPRADLLLIKRNTGDVADEVDTLNFNNEGWFGPAAFDGTSDGD
jgi:putative zinc finger protein